MLHIPTRKRLSLLLAVLIGGTCAVAIVAVSSVLVLRGEIERLSRETSPMQVRMARVQSGFERISGDFGRLSLATSPSEVDGIEGELRKTIRDLRSTASGLPSGAGITDTVDALEGVAGELSRMARERIAARSRITATAEDAAREAQTVLTATTRLSGDMDTLERSSRSLLASSKTMSIDANSAVKALLSERARAEQLRSSVQEIRLIDRKFRLNVARDNTAGIVGAMLSQDFTSPKLGADIKSFTTRFSGLFDGDKGVLAARAAVIATPGEKAQALFEERQNAALASIDQLSSRLAEQIDSLEMAVRKADTAMNGAADLTVKIAAVTRTAAKVDALARGIEALVWQLSSAPNPGAVDRIAAEAMAECRRADSTLTSLRRSLGEMKNESSAADVDAARAAFGRMRDLLSGNGGVAAAVRSGMETQAAANALFSAARNRIDRAASAGSTRARQAEGAQQSALSRIGSLTVWTFIIVGFVSVSAVSAGAMVGIRVRAGILASEARQSRDTGELRAILVRMAEGARTLRITARRLEENSQAVASNVERIASGAGDIHSGITEIAKNATEAATVGASATDLASAASETVSALESASSEIGHVTGIIREIAFKTTLLSLNAAVEAAHAGAAGAGFAVVAEEVKGLASTAAGSTEQIDARVTAMNAHVEKMTGAISGIAAIVARMRAMQESIAAAMDKQTSATTLISKGIQETARNCGGASSREGIHAMARELSRLAEDLEAVCSDEGRLPR